MNDLKDKGKLSKRR